MIQSRALLAWWPNSWNLRRSIIKNWTPISNHLKEAKICCHLRTSNNSVAFGINTVWKCQIFELCYLTFELIVTHTYIFLIVNTFGKYALWSPLRDLFGENNKIREYNVIHTILFIFISSESLFDSKQKAFIKNENSQMN